MASRILYIYIDDSPNYIHTTSVYFLCTLAYIPVCYCGIIVVVISFYFLLLLSVLLVHESSYQFFTIFFYLLFFFPSFLSATQRRGVAGLSPPVHILKKPGGRRPRRVGRGEGIQGGVPQGPAYSSVNQRSMILIPLLHEPQVRQQRWRGGCI